MRIFKPQLLHPKYWLLAVILMTWWCVAHLPLAWQAPIGRGLGRMLYRIKKVRHVSRCNLRLCYPTLSEAELERAVHASCVELGMSIIETLLVWFRQVDRFLEGRYVIQGGEHMDAAFAEGRGVIVLACHQGAVDINAALLDRYPRGTHEFVGTYKASDSVVNSILGRLRAPFTDHLFPATYQRSLLRALRRGDIVWFAPDIEVLNKTSVFVDFMGVPASTTTAISRFAKATNAVVIPCRHHRVDDRFNYVFEFMPPLANFPSNNPLVDARAVNAAIESIIQHSPYRYWWVIKRFRKRPQGEPRVY